MAATYQIEDDKFNDGTTCTSFYGLRIRKTSIGNWIELPNQYASPIVISNLDEGIEYQVEITRHCCDNSVSDPAYDTFTTTLP